MVRGRIYAVFTEALTRLPKRCVMAHFLSEMFLYRVLRFGEVSRLIYSR